jgi:hypothetical protein
VAMISGPMPLTSPAVMAIFSLGIGH